MSEILTLAAVFLVGCFASVFGTMVGGGTLLTLPFLMLLGLPPHVAVATERFGGLGQTLTSLYTFSRHKTIIWKYVAILTVISSAGALVGANILISVDPTHLQNAIGYLLILLVPLTFIKPKLGIESFEPSRTQLVLGSLLYFLVQIFAAFFGGGTGILVAYTLLSFFGLTILEATATKIIPWFFLTLVSLFIFAQNNIIDYRLGSILMLGMAAGGSIGAHIALKKGNSWIKRLFYLLVLVTIARLLL